MMAHPKSLLQQEIPTGSHAKAIVGVVEFRGNAGTRRRSRHLDVMAPRASSRGATAAGERPLRIPLGRNGIVGSVVQIGAPFVHVVAKIVEAIRVRCMQSDWLRARFPAARVIGKLFRWTFAPGKRFTFHATTRGALPFGLSGQP